MSAADPTFPEIPGVQLREELGQGERTVLFGGVREDRAYVVELHRDRLGVGDDGNAGSFARRAAALARVRHPGLVAIRHVGTVQQRPYAVRDRVSGHFLAEVLRDGPMDTARVVRIGLGLTRALGALHGLGLVHRGLDPHSILLDERGEAFLLPPLSPPPRGQLPFPRAPELRGTLARPVDERADLYALGFVLIACATGKEPSDAPWEEALSGSPALAAILRRLTAPDPDERYQSTAGLEADLSSREHLEEAMQRGEQPALDSPFDLGLRRSERPMLGREAEQQRLLRAWEWTVSGRGGSVTVAGPAGIGKSRLLRTLTRHLRRSGALVLAGACTDESPWPCAPLGQALDRHIQALQRRPQREREEAIRSLVSALGEASGLFAAISPELARLPGVEEAPEAGGARMDRVHEALAEGLLRLARATGPMALVLEDVHRVDDRSLAVLRALAPSLGRSSLLVVATSRNEHPEREAFQRYQAYIAQARVDSIDLRPLGLDAAYAILSDQLGGGELDHELARRIARRSGCNPFLLGEYVRAMLEQGMLRPSWGRWSLVSEGLDELGLPQDVMALVLGRIERLGAAARRVLALAAVMGMSFDLRDLLAASSSPDRGIYAAMGEAMQARILERLGTQEYGFVHERLREVLLAELEPEELRERHQRIAEALDRGTGLEDRSRQRDRTYLLAHHYARGTVERDPQRAHGACLTAGLQAHGEFAADKAWLMLSEAMKIASDADIEPRPELLEALGEVCYRTGRLSEGIAWIERALTRASTPLDQARIHRMMADLHLWSAADTGKAWEHIRTAFAALGAPYPTTWPGRFLSAAWYLGLGLVAPLLPRATSSADERARTLMLARLYTSTTAYAYFDLQNALFVEIAARQLWAVRRIGPSPEQADCYTALAVIAAVLGWRGLADTWAKRAVAVAREVEDRWMLASTVLYEAITASLLGETQRAADATRSALERHGPWAETLDYLVSCLDLSWNLSMRGYVQEARLWLERAEQQAAHAMSQSAATRGHAVFALPATLDAIEGHPAQGRAVLDRVTERQAQGARMPFHTVQLDAQTVGFLVECGELGAPFEEAVARFDAHRIHPALADFHAKSFYVYQAYGRAQLCAEAPDEERAPRRRQLAHAVAQLRWAANIPILRAHLRVLEANLTAQHGRYDAAQRRLERAEEEARSCDSPWVLWEAARLRVSILRRAGRDVEAQRSWERADSLARTHGWVRRRELLEGARPAAPSPSR
jgi:ABC-type molybdenum transport system ATPase subunit/photorepair protein PhrA